MNGVILARALLLNSPALMTALGVGAAGRIIVGVIPATTALPAIAVSEVVATEHTPLTGGRAALVRSHVQITVAAYIKIT